MHRGYYIPVYQYETFGPAFAETDLRRADLETAIVAHGPATWRTHAEIAVLNNFAAGYIASVDRGNPLFIRKEDMRHLLNGIDLAGLLEL